MTKKTLLKAFGLGVVFAASNELAYRIGQGSMLGVLLLTEVTPENAYKHISDKKEIRFKLVKLFADNKI